MVKEYTHTQREREREREREKFIDNQQVTEGRQAQRPVGKHRRWASELAAQHMAASTIPPLSPVVKKRRRVRLPPSSVCSKSVENL
jgi:hypothetical protein